MVETQGVYGSSEASVQITVSEAPAPPYINYPLIIGGIALLGIIAAVIYTGSTTK